MAPQQTASPCLEEEGIGHGDRQAHLVRQESAPLSSEHPAGQGCLRSHIVLGLMRLPVLLGEETYYIKK